MNRFIIHESVNKWREPPPVNIPELYLGQNSFIEMLFNNDYSETSYEWRYREETNMLCWPRVALRRLQIYAGASKYLVLDPAGDNVFILQPDDFTMLNALLSFRADATALVIVDATGTVHFDSTTNILYGRYESLSTELSQLIWVYFDLFRGNLDRYNTDVPISTGGFIETCYEQYVLDWYFRFLSDRVPDLIYDPCEGSPC